MTPEALCASTSGKSCARPSGGQCSKLGSEFEKSLHFETWADNTIQDSIKRFPEVRTERGARISIDSEHTPNMDDKINCVSLEDVRSQGGRMRGESNKAFGSVTVETCAARRIINVRESCKTALLQTSEIER